MYKASSEHPAPDGEMNSSAMIKIKVDGSCRDDSRRRQRPRPRPGRVPPESALHLLPGPGQNVHLIDYKVRVLETGHATGSHVRVLIESTDGHRKWITCGRLNGPD